MTFNRAPKDSEIDSMRLELKETSSSSAVTYKLFAGLIQTVTTPEQGMGTYTVSGKTISLTLSLGRYITSFSV